MGKGKPNKHSRKYRKQEKWVESKKSQKEKIPNLLKNRPFNIKFY